MTEAPAAPAKHPVVLIHGLWMTPRSWEGWAERFRGRGHEVRTPAWPGLDGEVADLRRDPSAMAGVTAKQILDHYEGIIRALPSPPIIMGHSFGGGFTQVLLDRGLGAAGVGVDSAPPKGVLKLPFSTIRSAWGILRNPANRGKAVPFTPKQFKYAFGNLLSEEESQKAWERYAVPAVGHVLMEGANANLSPKSALKVDYSKADRAPLLLLAGGKDHVVPAGVTRSNAKKYKSGLIELKEYPGRSHYTVAQDGWEEVADYALDWATQNAKPS
jgi:pimeloyl-ACP methyl ester carboxylesterase